MKELTEEVLTVFSNMSKSEVSKFIEETKWTPKLKDTGANSDGNLTIEVIISREQLYEKMTDYVNELNKKGE